MAEGIKLATAYIQVVASARGVRSTVAKELRGVTTDADRTGRTTGKNLSSGITQGADSSGFRKKLFGGMEREGESLGKRVGGKFSSGFKALAKGGALGAGALVGGALVKGMGRLTAIDSAEGKLTGLGHSAKSVDGIMKNALGSVKGTAFGLDEAASTAAGTVAAGIKPGKELEKTLSLVADSATIAGTDMSSMGSIWNKVAATGKIQGDTIAQLGDQGIPILQFLSKEMGVSSEEVSKLASEGKVDFKTFRSAMETGLGGAAQKSGDTFAGAMKNVGAAAGRLGASMLSGVFPQMKDGFGGITEFLDKMGPAAETAGKFIGRMISGVVGTVTDLYNLLFKGDFTGLLGLNEDSAAVGFLFDLRETVIGVFGEIKGGITGFANAWKYNDGEITSSGFPGFMERAGYAAHQLFDFIKDTAIPTAVDLVKWVWKNKDTVLALGGAVLAGVVAFKAFMFIKTVIAVVKAARLAVLAFNASLLANPLGLVAIAIGVLVGALIYLYKNNEDVRKAIDSAWASIKSAIAVVVDWVKTTGWPILKQVFAAIGAVVKWLWTSVIKPYMGFMVKYWLFVFGYLRDFVWPIARTVFKAIGAIAKWLWTNAIKPTFGWILAKAKAVFGWIKTTGWPWVRTALSAIGGAAKSLWSKWIKPYFQFLLDKAKAVFGWMKDTGWPKIRSAFNSIKKKAQWLWDKVKVPFDNIKAGAAAVKEAFVNARDGIKTAWDKVYGYIKSPIEKAITWLNDNFIDKINGLLKAVGVEFRVPRIPTGSSAKKTKSKSSGKGNQTGSWKAAFATGGWTGPGPRMKPAGVVHADEYVLKKEATNRLRKTIGLGGLDHMNRTGRLPELGGYDKGGIVALGRRIQGLGYHVSEHPDFGGVVPGAHAANGYHYKRGALDINADSFNSKFTNEMSALDKLNAMLRGEGWNTIWRAANHFDHLHVDVANGQKGGLVSGMLSGFAGKVMDGGKKVLNDIIDKLPGGDSMMGQLVSAPMRHIADGVFDKFKAGADAMMASEGPMSFSSQASGSNVDLGRSMAKEMGWSGNQWLALKELWTRESNWRTFAKNPSSGAYGIPQSLPASKMANRSQGGGPDYLSNPKTQISWGLKYIKDRYGDPASALGFHNQKNWYADGGHVKKLFANAPVFDNGGELSPGFNLVNNKLGRPEALRRPEQMGSQVHISFAPGTEWLADFVQTEISHADEFASAIGRGA